MNEFYYNLALSKYPSMMHFEIKCNESGYKGNLLLVQNFKRTLRQIKEVPKRRTSLKVTSFIIYNIINVCYL